MKKFIIALVAVLTLGATQAMAIKRVPKPGWSEQLNLGMSISNLRGWASDPKVGYDASFLFEYMFKGGKGTYINFGPELNMQGCKWDDEKLRTYYLSVPVHVGFRYNVSRKVALNAELGPYFAVGLGGKCKYDDDGISYSEKFFSTSGYDANRFDCGIGFRVGGEFKQKFSLNFGFQWGLTSTIDNPKPYDDVKTFNSAITFGYRF